jgi:acetylornithine deacetylase/succinyl-diaminopimelate desuccinylase-like protein
MASRTRNRPIEEAAAALGNEEPLRLLTQLVAIAPTNLEDPGHGRWEKPNYLRASEAIVRAARSAGLATRVYDPVVAGDVDGDWHGIARPNVIVDLDVGARETVLVLAHYDVVPVPTEQRARWKSPPHTLTYRHDGRLYGRGSNDDLGSGVVASLTAMRNLVDAKDLVRNVRLLACCDEETGGEGGIEAIKAHDERLAPNDPDRVLRAEVALIPDGSPETTAGSSGVAFLEASFDRPVSLTEILAYGRKLVELHELARAWKSVYLSPDWPDRNAPEPVITGRASVTQFDLTEAKLPPEKVGVLAAHAETDAANQVARVVTLLFGGPTPDLNALRGILAPLLPKPFRIVEAGPSALSVPPGTRALQVVGEATHGGYPHRGHNPVPAALDLLRVGCEGGMIAGEAVGVATFTVDLRLIPEMELADGLRETLNDLAQWSARYSPHARVVAPPARCRSGYALPVDHPMVLRFERILRGTLGVEGVRGEYGGTDASALRGLTTPGGQPLPAIVFGSMDPESHIHDAEESADPRMIAAVAKTIERFVREP